MLSKWGWPERQYTKISKMAAAAEDYFGDEDLDAILLILEENILENNTDFTGEFEGIVDEINDEVPAAGFQCSECEKVCKSQRGLTRHRNVKHAPTNTDSAIASTSQNVKKTPEELLHPLYFKKYVNASALKLAKDECYSEKTREEFDGYTVTLDEANASYAYVRDVIGQFKGNAEKFYPKFYKCISADEVIFQKLSRKCSVLLGCEVANHVLAHITGSIVKENTVEFPKPCYSAKEINIIKYLSGYVFSTMYRRLRRSKATQSMLGVQCLNILIVGKQSADESCESDVLIKAKDRGGLWSVTPEVHAIFTEVETSFRESTANFGRQIDSKKMVSKLMENSYILCNFNKLRNISAEKVEKEIALNLLDHLITLYIRVRTFSLVKDKIELHKIASKKKKTRSLRTEIKKSSVSLDKGH